MSVTLDVLVSASFTSVVAGQPRPVLVHNPAHQDMDAAGLLVHENAVLIRARREFLTRPFHGLTVASPASTVFPVGEIRLIDSARSGATMAAMLRLVSPVEHFESVRFSRADFRTARLRANGDFWAAMQILGVIPAGWASARPVTDSRVSVAGACPVVREVRWMDWCTIFLVALLTGLRG